MDLPFSTTVLNFIEATTSPAQLLGWLGLTFGIIRYQMRTTTQIRIMNVITVSTFGAHYFLMGAIGAAIISYIAALRSLILLNKHGWQRRRTVAGVAWLTAATIIMSADAMNNWIMFIPLAGFLFSCLEDMQEKVIRTRALGFGRQGIWLLYNLAIGSHGGAVNNVMVIMSNLLGLWRFHKHDENKGEK